MRKVVISEFMSLDGVMEDPGGAEGFEYGGWTIPFWNDELGAFKKEELFDSDALLLGRVTYTGFAAAWPSMSDPDGFADRMNSNRKYVISSTLTDPQWNNTVVLSGDLVTEVNRIKEEPGQNIVVAGSAKVAQALLANDLVDELRLAVYPVVLGKGKRLFGEGGHSTLQLVSQQATSSGVVLLVYRRA
ncbi:MAG TPA: dihydrofolate reductase family protein [Acidimicrobiales bacterium]